MKSKTSYTTIAAALLFSIAPMAVAAEPADPAPRVEVTFIEPEEFTDVRDDFWGTDAAREQILAELEEFIVERGTKALPENYRLKISVTDVDLAGDFEPWRGAQYNSVRIVKDIYPPRIKLSYQVLGADGAVIAEGDKKLMNLSFMFGVSLRQSDPLRYEKDLLRDWISRDIRKVAPPTT